jgi:CheY-like chemotaxis protein
MIRHRLAGKRILVVDDQQGVREAIRCLLALDRHVVTEAQNGREALQVFAPGLFDLVITDYAMPVMAGNELAQKIKVMMPSQPILMISAYAEHLERRTNPVDAVLSKPFSPSELRRVMDELIGTA